MSVGEKLFGLALLVGGGAFILFRKRSAITKLLVPSSAELGEEILITVEWRANVVNEIFIELYGPGDTKVGGLWPERFKSGSHVLEEGITPLANQQIGEHRIEVNLLTFRPVYGYKLLDKKIRTIEVVRGG